MQNSLKLRFCLGCRTTYLEKWEKWYSQELYEYYRGRIGLSRNELYDSITENRYQELLKWLGQYTEGKRILDIGCGQGHFVDVAMRMGYQILGIETSQSAVEVCKQFDLPVRQMDAFSDDLGPSSYDVCTLFEVIEHVPTPALLLRRTEHLLVAGGYLYLTTPNFNSLERRFMQSEWAVICPEHLSYFTPDSIRALIEKHTSLEVQSIETRNIGVGAIGRHFGSRIRDLFGVKGGAKLEAAEVSRANDSHLRETIEISRFLRLAKSFANQILSATGMGSSMRVLCRKP